MQRFHTGMARFDVQLLRARSMVEVVLEQMKALGSPVRWTAQTRMLRP